MVAPADSVAIAGPPPRFVGRAGEKLDRALDVFAIGVEGRRAVDVGASTGGFTDCLLQRGASVVVAVDVGYGQIHNRIRSDPRVTVVERTNIRHASPEELAAPFDIVVADLSFISLALVAPNLASLGHDDADWVLLVKPQFEVGRDLVGKGGVVRDPSVHAMAIELAAEALNRHGVGVLGVTASPIRGADGNREFLIHARRTERTVDTGTVRSIVSEEADE
jgi:23S rRNA (cytidine1920-2'-O)/16S rRNA (cytidine1409-2'-O)-methyltransferase